jgi:ABC-type polysaccharide/polyol phosphate transport system ATPase subunit
LDGLWKKFTLPQSKRHTLVESLAAAISGTRFREEFWALQDISILVERGESLGVIGENGSGKSTLLRIIAGILRADRGTVEAEGSIAPIMELGVGFSAELTVLENISLYGSIMGFHRSEMSEKVEAVLKFSELSRFQDAPLRNLSTGMQARLAFSIAFQTDGEIFLLDEALAVGDARFREKCNERIDELRLKGKTVVVVSHDMDMIRRLSDKVLYLARGTIAGFGEPDSVTTQYLQDMGVLETSRKDIEGE